MQRILDTKFFSLRVIPPKALHKTSKMPRACPVEYRVERYFPEPIVGCGCHGLEPWRFTLALLGVNVSLHGASPWHPKNSFHLLLAAKREVPRGKPVASEK